MTSRHTTVLYSTWHTLLFTETWLAISCNLPSRQTLCVCSGKKHDGRSNIEAHYDLSNDLFKLFLDKDYMLYSCGIFDAEMGRYCLERRDLSWQENMTKHQYIAKYEDAMSP